MNRKFRSLICMVCSLIMVTGCDSGQSAGQVNTSADSYPEKSITVLQGFKAGGGSDVLAQITQPYLEKIIGQTFINQYIPGATGAIAWNQLAKSTSGDGYTISITNTPMLMTNYIMNEEIKYNISELEPIANVVTDPGVVVVAADSKYKTIEELLEDAKNRPGEVTIGNSGVGGDDFFTTLIAQKATGLKFQMIPFDGDGPSWQAAMGGKIDASFNNLGIVFPQVEAKNLRMLAIFSEKRNEMVPDVPTLREIGYDVVSGSSRGYSAPKGISEDIKAKLCQAFKTMSEDSAFLQGAKDRALVVDMKIGDDYKTYLKEQEAVFKEIWNEVKDQYQ